MHGRRFRTLEYQAYLKLESKVQVEKVSLKGGGVLILTGPSSCGKGEVAAALRRVMSIPKEAHLSMGEILRSTFQRAKEDQNYSLVLQEKYQISQSTNIFECLDTTPDLTRKVLSHHEALAKYYNRENVHQFLSQVEWLEFCTIQGLLVPNRWTQSFLESYIETSTYLRNQPFILDGYPRTVVAAEHLISILKKFRLPIIKILHLSISKQEMMNRALQRGREDDAHASLISRYQFYTENVQPSVDYLKIQLGTESVALIDAHQPVYVKDVNGELKLNLQQSIHNVVVSALRSLGVPRVIIRDLLSSDTFLD